MSFTLVSGTLAPDFELVGSDGKNHSLRGPNSVQGTAGTLLFFTCNHCPHVVGSEARMQAFYSKCASHGVQMVAIHSNETKDHPEDAFSEVIVRMQKLDFKWLALQDENQVVAKAYGAERTPHYFLINAEGQLVYSGRMDNSPRDFTKAQTHELADALEEMLAGRPIAVPHTPAIGCNIKWWDREKHWMPKEACDLDYLYQRKKS